MAAVLRYKSGGGHHHAGLHTGSFRIAQLLSSTTRLQVAYIVFPCFYEYPIFYIVQGCLLFLFVS